MKSKPIFLVLFFRNSSEQSLEYIDEAKWRVTLQPEELAGD